MKRLLNYLMLIMFIFVAAVFSRLISSSDFVLPSEVLAYITGKSYYYYCPYNNYVYRKAPYNQYPYRYPWRAYSSPYSFYKQMYPCPTCNSPLLELLINQ